jgi:hypothetical protein
LEIAHETRAEFEAWTVPVPELKEWYQAYNPVGDINRFFRWAEKHFPMGGCGLATLLLQHKLAAGRILRGSYAGQNHTLLGLPEQLGVDITADQYGGPKVYFGKIEPPWSTRPINGVHGLHRV